MISAFVLQETDLEMRDKNPGVNQYKLLLLLQLLLLLLQNLDIFWVKICNKLNWWALWLVVFRLYETDKERDSDAKREKEEEGKEKYKAWRTVCVPVTVKDWEREREEAVCVAARERDRERDSVLRSVSKTGAAVV